MTIHSHEKQPNTIRRVKLTAGITFVLLSLLSLASSSLLWACNRFFPLPEGQISPEDMALVASHTKLSNAWEATDSILLNGSTLAFLLLLFFLVRDPKTIGLKVKFLYAGSLAAALMVLPLPFGLTDSVFPLVNYLITPSVVAADLGIFLVLDIVMEALVLRKRNH